MSCLNFFIKFLFKGFSGHWQISDQFKCGVILFCAKFKAPQHINTLIQFHLMWKQNGLLNQAFKKDNHSNLAIQHSNSQ